MAYDDLFGTIDNCLGVSSYGVIQYTILTNDTNPVAIRAVGGVEVSITIFDVWLIPTTTVGGGTVTINTDIAGGGAAALTDAIAAAVANTVGRAADIDQQTPQNVVGPADTIEAVRANDGPGGDGAIVYIMFYLT